jgi:phosphatidylglycerol:prolipoprotein diacylglycerol transferase
MGVAFHIGSLEIHWYGIMLVIAIIAALLLARIEAKRRGENPDHVYTAVLIAVPLGFIGARAYHVIDKWSYYSQHPSEIIGGAGLGIFGAVIGGVIGMIIYTRWRKLSTLRWFDIAAPAVILAQAIGRWGNYFNQEVYGKPTSLPWGISIDNPVYPYTSDQQFHPLFAYESILNMLGCIMLLIVGRKYKDRLLDGDIFFIYLIYYSTIRFCLEWLRIEPWTIGGLPTACWVSIAAIIVSISVMIYRRKRRRRLDIDQPSEGGDAGPEPPSDDKEETA